MQATPAGVRGNGLALLRLLLGLLLLDRGRLGLRRRLPIQRVGLPFQLLGMIQQRQAVGLEREHGRNPALVRRFGSQGRC